MSRQVLFIPKSQLETQFQENDRKDGKIVPPEILTPALRLILNRKGKDPKPGVDPAEINLAPNEHTWSHSKSNEPNKIVESREFSDYDTRYSPIGDFTISFATVGSIEKFHLHRRHVEIYYSDHSLSGLYKLRNEDKWQPFPEDMKKGGAIVFGPKVPHKIIIENLTIIIEIPAVPGDWEEVSRPSN